MSTLRKLKVYRVSLPKTADKCSPTITARSNNVGITNLLSVAHFPMGGNLHQEDMKVVINKCIGGVSATIRTTYYKVSLANFLHQDGRQANAVLIIKKK